MIYNRAAHRYAKATIKSCHNDKNELYLVFQDMKNISVSFENSKELKLFVDSKVVKDLIKLNALKAVFKNSSNKTKDLMELLMKNKRISKGHVKNSIENRRPVRKKTFQSSPLFNRHKGLVCHYL